jgi:hypothetical protein
MDLINFNKVNIYFFNHNFKEKSNKIILLLNNYYLK